MDSSSPRGREVTTPDYLEHPTRVMTDGGYRTVAPLGTWTDIYSSEEIYNAMDNFGYKFKILRGYLFSRGLVFNDFINNFYDLKSLSSRTSPRFFIAKLILNTLCPSP